MLPNCLLDETYINIPLQSELSSTRYLYYRTFIFSFMTREILKFMYRKKRARFKGIHSHLKSKGMATAKGTTGNLLKLLTKDGYLKHEPYGSYQITEAGEHQALAWMKQEEKNEIITSIEKSETGGVDPRSWLQLAQLAGIHALRDMIPYVLWAEPMEPKALFHYYYVGKPDQLKEIIDKRLCLSTEDWIVDIFSLALARGLISREYFEDPSKFRELPNEIFDKIWDTLFPTMRRVILINKFDPPRLLEMIKDPRGKGLLETIFGPRRHRKVRPEDFPKRG